VLIVIHLALSSGAESILAKSVTSQVPNLACSTAEIAAVVVVLP
jgi:hypothetical protein